MTDPGSLRDVGGVVDGWGCRVFVVVVVVVVVEVVEVDEEFEKQGSKASKANSKVENTIRTWVHFDASWVVGAPEGRMANYSL